MSQVQKFFRPAERHEDGRYKRYEDLSKAGKEAQDFRTKMLGKFLLILLVVSGITVIILEANQRHEKALQTGEYQRMFSE